ncbi:MAG TPA: aminotransferase class I/II-fold pyridoxal phosphate-dependent enzyme [Candidatus Binataceae bacterium]|nr:aminotransferase class I/II-fold pyridoxal phosphate-dependent enzyme [Candidatus Binataceae bacterium]
MEIGIDRTHGGAAAPGVLDFSASLNPLGPTAVALAAYHAAAASIARYPDPYAHDLTAQLARRHGVAQDQVVAGNGSTQLIHLLARTLRPRRPFVAIPTFSEIANALVIASAPPRPIVARREREFALDKDQVLRAIDEGADAIFIGRPNSPTGAMLPVADAAEIAAACSSRRCWCVFDEAFMDFAGEEHSAIPLIAENSHLMVLRSLTKIFAIAGLRLGYLVAGSESAHRLREAQEPWSVNIVAERVALACLETEAEFVAQSRRLIESERAYMTDALASVEGLRVFSSCANFLMLEVSELQRPVTFAEHMLGQGIAVRDLRELPGCAPAMYRVAIRDHEANKRLIAAVRVYFD